MQEIFMASIPVIGALVLAVGGGLVHMSRKIEAMSANVQNLRDDVQKMEQRIYEIVRNHSKDV